MEPTEMLLELDRLVAGGEALGRGPDGRVVFVRGGLPGETAMVRILESRRDWSRGVCHEVRVASSHRVVPPCERRREGCGGCDWQHLDAAHQLESKASVLRDALRRTGRLADPMLIIGGSVPSTGYRTTVRVIGTPAGRAGFRAERSHDTVPAAGCLVAHPGLEALLRDLELTPGLEVVLRVSGATGERTASWDPSIGDVSGLPADVATGPEAAVHEEVAGHRLRVSVASFFQSGPSAAELLVDAVVRAAPELTVANEVVDAYGGVGLFAVAAVPTCAHVTVVESSSAAVADARVNLDGRTATVTHSEFGRWRADRPVDVVIADPARTGLAKPGVAAVAATGAATVVLVSCDPVAVARDAALLDAAGYSFERCEVLDLFPMTHHVETVTRFTLRSGGASS